MPAAEATPNDSRAVRKAEEVAESLRRVPSNVMRWLRMLYLSNGFAVGALYGFVPVLLLSKGFDPALIGLTTGLGSVAYSFALPAWGHMGDILTGPRRALQLACIPAAVFALGLSAPLPIVAVIACLVIVTAGGGPTAALTDAMAMPILANSPREYSRLRLLSSFGGAAMAIVCGLLYSRTGYVAAPFVYVVTMGLMIFSAHKVPLGRDSERHRNVRGELEGRAHSTPARGRFGSVGEALSGRPRLLAVLASVLLIFIGFMAAATYISVRISDLGGGPMEVGLSNGLAWGAEVPGLILAGWLVSRVGLRPVLAVAAVGFAVCLTSWIFFVDAGPILFTRFISGVFFGGILITFVLTIAQLLPAGLQATGQTLFQAAAFGVAAVVANLLGGVLYSVAGPLGVFGGGAICTLAGGALGLVAVPKVLTVPTSGVPEPLPLSV
jgi:MFS transporter, PPP family, 3-phenylpropionic acid transporter